MLQIVVYDQLSACPYIEKRIARMPLRRPFEMTSSDFDNCLSVGDRRLGHFLYRTECPNCQACEAIRIPVRDFVLHRTHRRTLKKGDIALQTIIKLPQVTNERVSLYNSHKVQRGLDHGDAQAIDAEGYKEFLVDTCCNTLEFSYWNHNEELLSVAVSDRGVNALNAVYCYYNPQYTSLSLGTYNVLKQIEYCQQQGMEYLYLGYYIADSIHMTYKANFLPHERLLNGQWKRFNA
jgi:leucyl-tRNA---protein transferase